MNRILRHLAVVSLLLSLAGTSLAADWTLPITISSGSAATTLTLGIQAGATNGYDVGQDTPTRDYEEEVVYASFPHPEWGVVVGGQPMPGFLRDIRGTLPQEFGFEVRTLQSQLTTLSWNKADLPEKTTLVLVNPSSGMTLDMTQQFSYSFTSDGPTPLPLKIQAAVGDISPPQVPTGLTGVKKDTTIFYSWAANTETDLAGYKVHYGQAGSTIRRTVDVRSATNYSLFNLTLGQSYSLAVSAYDANGNESVQSAPYQVTYANPDTTPPLAPAKLAVVQSGSTLVLSWKANVEPDLAGYRVYQGSSATSLAKVAELGKTTTSYTVSPLPTVKTVFAVSAIDTAGNESLKSRTVSWSPPTTGGGGKPPRK